MERTVLHCDLNNFFASVECRDDRSLDGKPVAVCGDEELRHGIILAKNQLAKAYGVATGEAIWQARLKCPNLTLVHAHYEKYVEASRLAKEIYYSYTDLVESFGIDECWLDVSGSALLFGDGKRIADEIRERIKRSIGITASAGVSFNKIFAKLASDMKKPDATTVIPKDSFRDKVWPLPAKDLLFVGRATSSKFDRFGIRTIGDIARTDMLSLKQNFGKAGVTLWRYANGLDDSPVSVYGSEREVKSVGNSTTTPRDLVTDADVRIVLWRLCEKVSFRLRSQLLRCSTVTLYERDFELYSFERQMKLDIPVCTACELFGAAYELFYSNRRDKPIRSLGVRASDLTHGEVMQFSVYPEMPVIARHEALDEQLDHVRERFGKYSVVRAVAMTDPELYGLNLKENIIAHPFGS